MKGATLAAVAACALLAMAAAGCQQPRRETPRFDGEAAYAFVEGLLDAAQGAPTYRIPGTEGHNRSALWLWSQMQAEGWQGHWQNFTGQDYVDRLEAGQGQFVLPYYQSPTYCKDEARERLPGLHFSNLYAILPSPKEGGGSGRTLFIAAHWDSQMHSDEDPDPAKRSQPDPAANDGASGVGVILELMRTMGGNGVELPFDLGILLTDGEDGYFDCYPLAGAIEFTRNATTAGLASRLLLLDMVGDLDARFPRESNSVQSDPAFVDVLWRHGQEVAGLDRFNDTRRSVSDDHVAFIAVGIPSVDLIDVGRDYATSNGGFPPYWDTTDDTLEHISPRMLGMVGQAIVDTLLDPELAETWPERS
jgi:hypothetical protein